MNKMKTKDVDDMLPAVVALTQQVGKAIMEIYQAPDNLLAEKKDKSPLTKADVLANTLLKEGLAQIENLPYLSEESKKAAYEKRRWWEAYWLVDPLDGTKEFIKKTGEFTVNIALLHNNELLLGVVCAPALELIYYGSKKSGSYRKPYNGSPLKLPCVSDEDNSFKVLTSRSHSSPEELHLTSSFTADQAVSYLAVGSSLKFCQLAEGNADFYPRSGPTHEWDTAAGHAILNFSGGSVLDLESRKPLPYNKKNLLNGGFIAFSQRQVKRLFS